MPTTALQALRRTDYRAPDFLIDTVELEFDLRASDTRVRARLALRRNAAENPGGRPLVLHGGRLETVSIAVDGRALEPGEYAESPDSPDFIGKLVVHDAPDRFTLSTEVRIDPDANTSLVGLYRSGGNYYTDLEPEGFRKLTWFLDRPDVMARYTTRIEADKASCPVLLANGNPAGAGELAGGRHWARWEDPFPKPSYLFALVAGDLGCLRGSFETMSGRDVRLEVWTEHENVPKCAHALRSLQRAMRWDEERFGREYDLDVYMIVAVGDFNGGAMENKGLNVFNSKYVLAAPETATDEDYEGIEGVIAHEYFHNWTGNRVTLRDWFQLTLKEGLTVYRDQEFSADMTSPAMKRIASVRNLRERQFPQDAGPMAHSVRPEEVVEMGNFYTATVYEKGAEVIRMYATLLGRDGFRRGMDLYFERHDGSAVTCDDFRAAMADANGRDLAQFGRWYAQSGTPTVTARCARAGRELVLTLSQSLPEGKLDPGPLSIPVRMGLLGADGAPVPLAFPGQDPVGAPLERVLELNEREQSFRFVGIEGAVVPSLFRGFSAPVRCAIERTREELAFLLAHDVDPVTRWDAGQELALGILVELAGAAAAGRALALDPRLAAAFGEVLDDASLDGSLVALTLRLPDDSVVAQSVDPVDPAAIESARRFAERGLAAALAPRLERVYAELDATSAGADERAAIDRRRKKNLALGFLCLTGGAESLALARRQFERAGTMSDAFAALKCLVDAGGTAREEALRAFYARWKHDPLVLDKWFAVQALSTTDDAFERVLALTEHPDFTRQNPNRMRSLLSTFSQMNHARFHRADGAAYEFLADEVLAVDALNPKTAARLATAFLPWRRFEPVRKAAQEAALRRLGAADLSKDVGEVVGRSLEG
jgi:aminopeptidase N